MPLSPKEISSFRQTVYDFYAQHGRAGLPWRTTPACAGRHTTPYHILVSEIMLQQTQVERVIPKFLSFMTHFPTIQALASAKQSDVLRLWSGLGYNRRALNLQRTAQAIVADFGSVIPNTMEQLISLPGIGPYTATAILAFAYNVSTLVIETNIRTVYLYHFFQGAVKPIPDTALLPLISQTLDSNNPREWYGALMDYGAHLKATYGNLARQSKAYSKQSAFAGSDRQLRGAILKSVTIKSPQTTRSVTKMLMQQYHTDQKKITTILDQLHAEKFITLTKTKITLN